jgi:hypothetical protein
MTNSNATEKYYSHPGWMSRIEQEVEPTDRKLPYLLITDEGMGLIVMESIAKKIIDTNKLTSDKFYHLRFWGYRQSDNVLCFI